MYGNANPGCAWTTDYAERRRVEQRHSEEKRREREHVIVVHGRTCGTVGRTWVCTCAQVHVIIVCRVLKALCYSPSAHTLHAHTHCKISHSCATPYGLKSISTRISSAKFIWAQTQQKNPAQTIPPQVVGFWSYTQRIFNTQVRTLKVTNTKSNQILQKYLAFSVNLSARKYGSY